MKVIFICETDTEAQFVRDNHHAIADSMRHAPFGRALRTTFDVVAQLRPPTHQELLSLLEAMGSVSIQDER